MQFIHSEKFYLVLRFMSSLSLLLLFFFHVCHHNHHHHHHYHRQRHRHRHRHHHHHHHHHRHQRQRHRHRNSSTVQPFQRVVAFEPSDSTHCSPITVLVENTVWCLVFASVNKINRFTMSNEPVISFPYLAG